MNGVKIGEKHSFDEFGLILSSKTISPPSVQTSKASVPLRDGSIDLTEAITDVTRYDNRKIQMTFSVIDPMNTWTEKVSAIENYIHGQKMKLVFDDDIAFYYIGRLSVNSWSSNKSVGKLVIECDADPFKYDVISSAVDWEWDVFDFEDGIINETGQLIVDGTTTITLICRKKRMFPIFTASTEMTVKYDGETYNLKAGSQKMYDIFLVEGENVLAFNGNGTVSIDYIGGSL